MNDDDVENAVELSPLSTQLTPYMRRCKQLFDGLDRDGDGKIPLYEFRNEVQFSLRGAVAPAVLTKLIENADKNNDGFITVEEFLKLAETERGKKLVMEIWLNSYVTKVVGKRRREPEVLDGEYEDEYSWCPPPLMMIMLSLIQIALYVYYSMDGENLLKNPVSRQLIYDPYRKKEAWRFITYMFIHSSWPHLLVNMSVQVMLGLPLEMVHGWWRVLSVYLMGVLVGSLATSVSDPKTFLAGASGGVYSLITAHLATITLNWAEMEFPCIQLMVFLVLMISDTAYAVYQRYILNLQTQIGYVAHFGGAVAGLLFGLFMLRNLQVHNWENKLKITAITAFTLLLVALCIATIFI